MHDACIVGGGPAGLSAALVLGRCRRDVVVFDSGQPRNAASRGLHCYLSRDGVHPMDLRKFGRQELTAYPSVQFTEAEIASAQRCNEHFELVTKDAHPVQARLLLLATGRIDVLPEIPGLREHYGRGVYHCPYCDGWEHRDQRLIAFGDAPPAVELALELRTWTHHVTLCASEPATVPPTDRERLQRRGIVTAESPIVALESSPNGAIRGARLADGGIVPCEALFFTTALPQKSPLAQSLGCQIDAGGSVVCTKHAATGVPGVYVAGNVRGGVHLAIMAAAEGAEAAIAMNEELSDRECRGS